MGKIEIDHTGSGGGITLSSDGTSLLLGGTAIGGGGADLFAENYDGTSTLPSATGTNAVAMGVNSQSKDSHTISIGHNTIAGTGSGSDYAVAIGYHSDATGYLAMAIGGNSPQATGTSAVAIGGSTIASGNGSVAIHEAYSSGTDSLAMNITTNSSSYGATGANSIAIGKQASASSTEAVAIGGNFQTASATYSSTIGGTFNTNQGSRAIIAGGQSNTIDIAAQYSVIVGGNNNNVTGDRGVIVGGSHNEANASHTFATGQYAKAAEIGKLARATGRFSADGDAQGGQFILRADTTDATATVLTTNNSTAASTNQIVAASDTCITFDGTITAMQNGAQAYASWRIEGLLVNDGGTTTLANSATTVISNADGWGMALSADNTNNALAITCTGEASHNIRWVANIRTSEVTYA